MGGHGGLNILPQKKWNVYNYDNRAIVDKDKKEAADKKRDEFQKERQNTLDGKMSVLKQERGIEEIDKSKGKPDILINSLNSQFKKLNENGHINLFEKEQKIIENKEIFQIKKLQQAEFLKDKNMDFSSKFLGTYAEGTKKAPWYARQKGFVEQKIKPAQLKQLISVKKSDSHTINEVVKIESHGNRNEAKGHQQRSRDKNYKDNIKDERPKSEMEILREKRLKREQKQKQRVEKLRHSRENDF